MLLSAKGLEFRPIFELQKWVLWLRMQRSQSPNTSTLWNDGKDSKDIGKSLISWLVGMAERHVWGLLKSFTVPPAVQVKALENNHIPHSKFHASIIHFSSFASGILATDALSWSSLLLACTRGNSSTVNSQGQWQVCIAFSFLVKATSINYPLAWSDSWPVPLPASLVQSLEVIKELPNQLLNELKCALANEVFKIVKGPGINTGISALCLTVGYQRALKTITVL